IRHDYFPDVTKFVQRIAGNLHEAVIRKYEALVTGQLNGIWQSDNQIAADFAQGAVRMGSSKVADEEGGSHCPDESHATELGVILEVSHSQQRQDLPFLADAYILGSCGLTQLVIGIDLEYQENKGKEARVIAWRPKLTKKKGKTTLTTKKVFESIFRNADWSLANGRQNLWIWLKDFGNKLDCSGINNV
ncbi:hypothetical protein B0T25DRAFT_597216, partial [Lasiosphaeria hispida]